jgi:hypothetical protein
MFVSQKSSHKLSSALAAELILHLLFVHVQPLAWAAGLKLATAHHSLRLRLATPQPQPHSSYEAVLFWAKWEITKRLAIPGAVVTGCLGIQARRTFCLNSPLAPLFLSRVYFIFDSRSEAEHLRLWGRLT